MNSYLTKPIDKKELFNELVKWIEPGNRERNINSQEVEEGLISIIKLEEILIAINISEALHRVSGNVNLYVNILTKFEKDYKEFSSNLNNLIDNNDTEKSLAAIHTLKGISDNIGATQLSIASLNLETLMKNSIEIVEVKEKQELNRLNVQLKIVLDEIEMLREYLTKQNPIKEEMQIAISKELLITKLEELKEYLESYNTEASSLYEELKKYLSNKELREKYENLGELIGEYEFEEALERLIEIINLI